MRTLLLGLLLPLLLGTGACDRSSRSADPAQPSATAEAALAKDAPSADGICSEHGVLEVVCTKCNPKLIPVFRAKGDWCAEHELPESIQMFRADEIFHIFHRGAQGDHHHRHCSDT